MKIICFIAIISFHVEAKQKIEPISNNKILSEIQNIQRNLQVSSLLSALESKVHHTFKSWCFTQTMDRFRLRMPSKRGLITAPKRWLRSLRARRRRRRVAAPASTRSSATSPGCGAASCVSARSAAPPPTADCPGTGKNGNAEAVDRSV